ncbi:MAG: FGGY-family carbohydrate kinase [Spirochaetales bacterium]|nr:FGGY-family carbohydrate kinase [Spirochaetales bacterium]
MNQILSIDIGTSSLKAGIISEQGKLLEYGREYYAPGLQSSPRTWISMLQNMVKSFTAAKIDAIAVSGHGPSLVPATALAENSFQAIGWDAKIKIAENIKALAPNINTSFFLAKALYFKENFPEQYKAISFFLPPPELLNLYLSGQARSILPNSEYRHFYWDDLSIKAMGLKTEHFAPFIAPGETLGTLQKNPAKALGLKPGMPVFAAGPDFLMALLGSGTVSEGLVCNRMGSSEGMNLLVNQKINTTTLLQFPHLVPGKINLSGIINASGLAIEWFLRLTGIKRQDLSALSNQVFTQFSLDNSILFIPHLLPSRTPLWPENLKGSLLGLEAHHGKEDVFQALMEGLLFFAKDILVEMEKHADIKEIRLSGGPAENIAWLKMKASLFSKPLSLLEINDSELLGNALIATHRAPLDKIQEHIASRIHVKSIISPDSSLSDYIQNKYQNYRAISSQINRLFKTENPLSALK